MSSVAEVRQAIGIDIGTSNTRVAVFRNNGPEIIPDSEGRRSMPSYVSFTERERLIGWPAKSKITQNPENTIYGVHRFLHPASEFKHMAGDVIPPPFRYTHGQSVLIEADYLGMKRRFQPVEILAMILARAKRNAEAYLGSKVHEAVLGVPVFFSFHQRNLMQDAAKIAGLEVLHLTLAPSAIVNAWLWESVITRKKQDQVVFIVDLGARSLNVAVATVEDNFAKTIAVTSNQAVGGDHFLDMILQEKVDEIAQKWKRYIRLNKRASQRLRKACEIAVCDLSSAEIASFELDSLFEGFGGLDYQGNITRKKFESICQLAAPIMEESFREVLASARKDKDNINNIILAGGSSRIPKIQEIVSKFFPGIPLTKSLNPDEAGAQGLAIRASLLCRRGGKPLHSRDDFFSLDSLAQSIEIVGPCSKQEILSRNSVLPNRSHNRIRVRGKDRAVSVVEGGRKEHESSRLLAEIDLTDLKLPVDQEWVELQCDFKIAANPYEATCTLTMGKEDDAPSIQKALVLDGALSPEMLAELRTAARMDDQADEVEAARVTLRNDLDSRIGFLLETVINLEPSERVTNLQVSIEKVRLWTDENPFANAASYRRAHCDLDGFVSQLDNFKAQSLRSTLESKLDGLDLDVQPSPDSPTIKPPVSDFDVATEKAAASSGRTTSEPDHGHNPTSKDEDRGIDDLFPLSSTPYKLIFTDANFERISIFLKNTNLRSWSKVPRLYTVLRLIDQLDALETFLKRDVTDMWFPFDGTTFPPSFQQTARTQFLDIQSVVFSKGFKLETGSERKHAHFSRDDTLPFTSIAKLGIGSYGVVDKVMSNTTQREYARKLFRRVKGLRQQDVKTFINELTVLKRVNHKHCVELVASYTDPKFFALLMGPVGDYNLATYYDEASNNPDRLSLLRSFFGCLANAVQYLHSQKIRHRDIKPQNIIIKRDCVLLTDFGIAFNWENLTRGTTTSDSSKTFVYAAPEVIRVEARNESADTWSLGCVFLEMVTVLKGKTIDDMRHYFWQRKESHCFHANRKGILVWIETLQDCVPKSDNVALGWVKSMLQPDQAARPMAAELAESIVETSTRCKVFFCGLCCYQGADSSTDNEDDGHLWNEDSDDDF
ncbi:Hsp70 protein-domain-containing protein [Dactylonectria macrodidyma]|uniref:Hsp70 protein-domain-containing protein n=1 Tax=Dactylonectria macrodidyma TaxID=307937 RepID=A0A9P9J0C2_9HYPO|nr:Hsp70 protein-domain-containing protein [Dactylonectria macrodidyma]